MSLVPHRPSRVAFHQLLSVLAALSLGCAPDASTTAGGDSGEMSEVLTQDGTTSSSASTEQAPTESPADVDGDGYDETVDCDDSRADVHPGASETCDGHDNDCDYETDENAVDALLWYGDTDGDGFGDARLETSECLAPPGHVSDATDCDDTSASTHPGAVETCDGHDNDCNGITDDDAVDAAEWYADFDGDGHGDSASGTKACESPLGYVESSDDCDDSSATVYPEANEVCDELDNDCNGLIDDDAVDAAEWYADFDGDGYGDGASGVAACESPTGYVESSDDCDDSSATTYPGATEYCDELDNDCNGTVDDEAVDASIWYRDADDDGFGNAESSRATCAEVDGWVADDTDCADGLADVNPAAEEVCNDGLDNDCDETANSCLLSEDTNFKLSDLMLAGGGTRDGVGVSIAPAGDVDGDGHQDLLIGAPDANDEAGEAYLVYGPLQRDVDLSDADALLSGNRSADLAGFDVAGAGDLNNDGYDDLLVGAPEAYSEDEDAGWDQGVVYVVYGPVTGDLDLHEDAAGRIVTSGFQDRLGESVTVLGDVTSDGFPDIAVGAPGSGGITSDAGLVMVFAGPVVGELDEDDAVAVFYGTTTDGEFGESIGSADVNCDGVPDLLVGAPGEEENGIQSGAAYFFFGPLFGDFEVSDADASLFGADTMDRAGSSVAGAGDMDGDGCDEVLVGAPNRNQGSAIPGTAYIVEGATSGDHDLDSVAVALNGESDGDGLGTSVSTAGDVDGDGYADILVGAPGYDSGTMDEAGAAYLFYGPVEYSRSVSSHDFMVSGQTSDAVGTSVAGGVDLDADGFCDLLVGAPGSDSGADNGGAVGIFFGLGY